MSELKCYVIKVLVEQEVMVNAMDSEEAYALADDIARDEGWMVRDMWEEKIVDPLTLP